MRPRIRQKSLSGLAPAFMIGGRASSIFFLTLSAIFLVLTVVRPDSLSGVRTGATDMISPVLSAFSRPFHNAAEAVSSISGMASLRAENAQLKSENIRLREWYQTALMLQAENQSLQELLNVKIGSENKFITARVLSDAGNSYVKTVLVSSGKSDGVKKNQAVLAGEGLIGRVIESGNNAARVLLLTDINSRIPVVIEGSSQKAVMAGDNGPYPVLKHLPQDAGIAEGVRIMTSGHGGIFPAGLPVGRLVKNDSGKLVIKPYADMNRVVYVRVIDAPVDPNLIRGDIHDTLQ